VGALLDPEPLEVSSLHPLIAEGWGLSKCKL
jgi:hypothetical protein